MNCPEHGEQWFEVTEYTNESILMRCPESGCKVKLRFKREVVATD